MGNNTSVIMASAVAPILTVSLLAVVSTNQAFGMKAMIVLENTNSYPVQFKLTQPHSPVQFSGSVSLGTPSNCHVTYTQPTGGGAGQPPSPPRTIGC
jgi:hypothetical protein